MEKMDRASGGWADADFIALKIGIMCMADSALILDEVGRLPLDCIHRQGESAALAGLG